MRRGQRLLLAQVVSGPGTGIAAACVACERLVPGAAVHSKASLSHLHVHVFPRTADDRFHLEVRWQERSRAALDDDAAQVRAALERSGDHPGRL
jgi:hypothetical protein